MYDINKDREKIAKMIAAEASGFRDAHPDSLDYDIADEVIEFIQRKIVEE